MDQEKLKSQLAGLQEIQANPMGQIIATLEAENAKVGGILFSTFGRKDSKALVFPTPVTIQQEEVKSDELLVGTQLGFKCIKVDSDRGRIKVKDISDLIKERLGKKKSGFLSPRSGYMDGSLTLGGSLFIDPERTRDFRPTHTFLAGGSYEVYDNCRLVDVDDNRVEQILSANIERVKVAQAAAQKSK